MRTKLTPAERKRFDICKKQIADGWQPTLDTFAALLEVKEGKLYKEDFDTWEDFCNQALQLSPQHVNRLMAANVLISECKALPINKKSEPVGSLLPNEHLDTIVSNERQARALASVPPEQRVAVVQQAAATGRPLTAKTIKEAVAKVVGPETRKDAIGREIPSDILPDWDRADAMASKLRSLASEIKVTVERGLADKDIIFAEITNPTISEASGLHYTLSQIMPYSVCPTCQGRMRRNCQLCRRRGFISKYLYNSPAVSAETKALLEKVAR